MLDKILTKIFGNRVILVTAQRLHCYMRLEQQFVFDKKTSNKTISNVLANNYYYRVEKINKFRTKIITSPAPNHYRKHGKEKVVEWFE